MLPSTCSKVSLRQRPIKNDRLSLYLDYYPAIRNPRTMKMSSNLPTGSRNKPPNQPEASLSLSVSLTTHRNKPKPSHQCTVLARLIPHDTSSTHSANREWEVGKQSRYDHIDNQQPGTQLTM